MSQQSQANPLPINSPEAIERGLAGKTIAIVGLSSQPDSPSLRIARYLKEHGYRVIPVNPNEQMVLDEKAYPSLRDVPEPVDVVDIFRRPDAVPEIVEEAIEIGAPVVWMQLGIVNEDAAQRAHEAGLAVVMDHCMRQEHINRHGQG